MIGLIAETPQIQTIRQRLSALAGEFITKVTDAAKPLLIPAQSTLFRAGAVETEKLLFIKNGSIQVYLQGRQLFSYEQGDLVGLEALCGINWLEVRSDFAVQVLAIEVEGLLTLLSQDLKLLRKWTEFLCLGQAFFATLADSAIGIDVKFNPEVLNFEPGEIILEQGQSGDVVYTLIDGQAGVYVDRVRVGEVVPDEIFGVIAAITGGPRIATVIADRPSMVLALSRTRFLELIKARPSTVEKLITDMARQMVALNEKVVGLSGKRLLI